MSPEINMVNKKAIWMTAGLTLFFLIFALQYAGGSEWKDWMKHAKCYVKADLDMRAYGNVEEKFIKALKKRDACIRSFHDDVPPVEEEIKRLLVSRTVENRVIASVGTMLSGIKTKDIADRIVENVALSESYELTRYSLLALRDIRGEDMKQYEGKIYKAIERENKDDILGDMIMFLTYYPNEKTANILIELIIKRDSPQVKLLAYGALQKIGTEYAEQALAELKRRGDERTLNLLESTQGVDNPLTIK